MRNIHFTELWTFKGTSVVTACFLFIRCLAKGLVAVSGLLFIQSSTLEAAYPDRAITLIVPFAPGGSVDIIARIFSVPLSQVLGQQVIVYNRSGASGNIGMSVAARATPDGYTLLLTSTAIAINPALFKKMADDPMKEFVPISELVSAPNVLVVHPDSGLESLAQLVARAKADPVKYSYSSAGVGTMAHLTGELLKLRAGIGMTHVPFRSAGEAAQAVLTRQVEVGSMSISTAEPFAKDGQLKVLAVTSENRWFSMPNVPTMAELGFSGFVLDAFDALLAPVGTPPDIIDKLVQATRTALQRPETREALERVGFRVVAGTPTQLSARISAETQIVRELIDNAGIRPE